LKYNKEPKYLTPKRVRLLGEKTRVALCVTRKYREKYLFGKAEH
jgi:hypothetical protein